MGELVCQGSNSHRRNEGLPAPCPRRQPDQRPAFHPGWNGQWQWNGLWLRHGRRVWIWHGWVWIRWMGHGWRVWIWWRLGWRMLPNQENLGLGKEVYPWWYGPQLWRSQLWREHALYPWYGKWLWNGQWFRNGHGLWWHGHGHERHGVAPSVQTELCLPEERLQGQQDVLHGSLRVWRVNVL